MNESERHARQIDENRKISRRVDELESYVQMEDRVTATSVLLRLNELEESYNGACKDIELLVKRVDRLEEENKILKEALNDYRSYRTAIEDLETDVMYLKEKNSVGSFGYMQNQINELKDMYAKFIVNGPSKKPHKCPVCQGTGNHPDQTPRLMVLCKTKTGIICCETCEGKGIVWS